MPRGLLRGLATLLILAELAEGPKCGYEISKSISEKLGDSLPPGYVYVMLSSLRKKGLVVEVGASESPARRKRVYAISDQGREFLVRHLERVDAMISLLKEVRSVAERLAAGPGSGPYAAGGGRT